MKKMTSVLIIVTYSMGFPTFLAILFQGNEYHK